MIELNLIGLNEIIFILQHLYQLGLLGIFFIYMLPSFFLLEEVAVGALLAIGVQPISIIIFATLGGSLGNVMWYYVGKYSYKKLKKLDEVKTQKTIAHYKKLAFLYSGFPGGELLSIYGGVRHYHLKLILPYMIASNLIRASLGVAVMSGLITNIPDFLKQIIF